MLYFFLTQKIVFKYRGNDGIAVILKNFSTNVKDDYVKFKVDGKEVIAQKGLTVIQALAQNKINIPHFCFHEQLAIAGNCRMCLVQLNNNTKPIASCATNVAEGINIYTKTELVKIARENVLEFLLINHPLDCPICDQGGECDLQDISFFYGNDRSRFFELKRAVTNKYASPLIKMVMTRCIHCTRCTRFFDEYVGKPFFGLINRGSKTEIDPYVKNIVTSEISGNVTDLCPVGALTPKPSAFKGRVWEFTNAFSIDIFDTYGSPIILDIGINGEIVRILPHIINNDYVFISDKTRFIVDVLNYNRYEYPCILTNDRIYVHKEFETYLLHIILKNFVGLKYKFLKLGKFLDVNTQMYFKTMNNFLNLNIISEDLDSFGKTNVLFDSFWESKTDCNFFINLLTFMKESYLKSLILVNIHLRYEMPILNLKLREYSIKTDVLVVLFGAIAPIVNNHKYIHGGISTELFCDFVYGKTWVSSCFANDRLFFNDLPRINSILFNKLDVSLVAGVCDIIQNILTKLNLVSFNYYTLTKLEVDMTKLNSYFLNGFSWFNFWTTVELKKNNLKFFVYNINVDVINNFVSPWIKSYRNSINNNFYFNVYQGFFIEHQVPYLYEKNMQILLPTRNWLEYDAKTFTFFGKVISFFKIYNNAKFLKKPNYFLSFFYREYLVNNVKISFMDNNIKSLIMQDNNIYLNYAFYKNNIFIYYTKLLFFVSENKKRFNNILINFFYNGGSIIDIQPIFYFQFSSLFCLINHNYYKMDFLSKISSTLSICANLMDPENDF